MHTASRWFAFSFYFFAIAAVLAAGVAMAGPVVQIRVLGLVTLVNALVGIGVCTLGLHAFNPLQWSGIVARMRWRSVQVRDFAARVQAGRPAATPLRAIPVTVTAMPVRIAELATANPNPVQARNVTAPRLSLVRSYG
jgi:hypothetical protein